MATKLSKRAYKDLVNKNLVWLMEQPKSQERDHIARIVMDSVRMYYPKKQPRPDHISTAKDEVSE